MIRRFLNHLGGYSLMLKGMFTRPENGKVYWKEYVHQGFDIGLRSLPIVVIISVFLGAVMIVQTSYQLISPLIQKYIMAQVVRDSVILELAPTIICIVLAGVVGSKIASELGNMRVSEQIDALEIMGINTKGYLVMPKIIMALIMIPCLIVLAITLSIVGGWATAILANIMSSDQYVYGLINGFRSFSITVAMVKAFTFAFIIASVPAYYGYHVNGGALEIGRASTTSVIVSCIMILLADYVITMLML
ncbi:MAG TPA: ABC transporter permease [Edaphocola sp.]|nr:ABC transporter permease [Edaphocola sp.]